MHIDFKTSGGFANLRLQCSVDTATLLPNDAEELDSLVAQSNVLGLNQAELDAVPGLFPDVMTYELTVQVGDRTQQLRMTDISMPASVRPLVQRLRSLAIQQTRRS
ncbi:MAG: hypothetical protein KME20_14545 [Kaiparowitsia implicata GSE-PSE-MK54-09C]|jgi:hypothetical protein|nr:hypothetical protein [Kaiparowitsia implicata GSE-PSE-MK54-09C]